MSEIQSAGAPPDTTETPTAPATPDVTEALATQGAAGNQDGQALASPASQEGAADRVPSETKPDATDDAPAEQARDDGASATDVLSTNGDSDSDGTTVGDGATSTKKRRRRRRKKISSEATASSAQDDAGNSAEGQGDDSQDLGSTASPDGALNPHEVAEFKRTFTFLKTHQATLELELSDQEQPLLDATREPTLRGVCQHLLSKVDGAKTLALAGSLEGEARLNACGELLRFRREFALLLMYLEAAQSSGGSVSTDTLNLALRRTRYDGATQAELATLIEQLPALTKESERPSILMALLESSSYRKAAGDLIDELPAVFAPFQAVYAQLIKGHPAQPIDAELVTDGLKSLLRGSARGYERRAAPVRERMLRHALRHIPADSRPHEQAIEALLTSFDTGSPRGAQLEFLRIGGLLHREQDDAARKRLTKLSQRHQVRSRANAWLRSLNCPRIGRIALMRTRSGASAKPNSEILKPAMCLQTQRKLWLRFGNPNEASAFNSHLEVLRKAIVPGVAQPYASNITSRRGPYVAYLARSASQGRLEVSGALGEEQLLGYALDGVTMLAALAQAGVSLPDIAPDRFEIDGTGRLWLLDLWGASLGETKAIVPGMLKLAARWCTALILEMPFITVDEDSASILRGPGDFATLLAGLRRVGQQSYAD